MARSGAGIAESCTTCRFRKGETFRNLAQRTLQTLDTVGSVRSVPKGTILFREGQPSSGILIVCQGEIKLSLSSSEGRTLIIGIAETGEALGLAATILRCPYEVTAEAHTQCQIRFIRRDDLIRLMHERNELCLRVSEQLSERYQDICHEIRTLLLFPSAAAKLAKVLMDWSIGRGSNPSDLTLSHDEIAEMIGTSRETVSRLLARFRQQGCIELTGSTLQIRDRAALEKLQNG